MQRKTVKVEIDCENAAFDDPAQELARTFRALADRIENEGVGWGFIVHDLNGNSVGTLDFIGDWDDTDTE